MGRPPGRPPRRWVRAAGQQGGGGQSPSVAFPDVGGQWEGGSRLAAAGDQPMAAGRDQTRPKSGPIRAASRPLPRPAPGGERGRGLNPLVPLTPRSETDAVDRTSTAAAAVTLPPSPARSRPRSCDRREGGSSAVERLSNLHLRWLTSSDRISKGECAAIHSSIYSLITFDW